MRLSHRYDIFNEWPKVDVYQGDVFYINGRTYVLVGDAFIAFQAGIPPISIKEFMDMGLDARAKIFSSYKEGI